MPEDYICKICDMVIHQNFVEFHRDSTFIYGHCFLCDMIIVMKIEHNNKSLTQDESAKVIERIQSMWPHSRLVLGKQHNNNHWHRHVIIRR